MMKMLALAAATACALAAPGPANAADPVKIGVALSQTGNLADSAGPYFKGLDLWREQVNARGGLAGRPVEFVIYDDRSDPATAAQNFDTFFAKGWAPTWSDMGHGNWATDPGYAAKILAIYAQMVTWAIHHDT